ncbi:MAG TPA: UDP-N-acetylmuramoyl-tripeptide--D-alanyl-D-alanine ligase [Thermoanaerobaculia bacterium]|nr:UDP-N-acetylmuramoyl-tripeptide--D-alanyl-D-alanine ligase [Thermoanaerobaculia bacterium]
MASRTLEHAARVMGGRVVAGDPAAAWEGGSLDSRRLHGGELFFAIAGERRDGHEFVAAALAAGAAGAVVHRDLPAPERGALIRVDDTFAGLHALTRALRDELPARLVAITGSTGKTTTKELLADLLSRRFRVARSPGNLNNLYGFPLSVMGMPEDTEWMVAEMGMNTPGELSALSRLGRPEVAVFTNVRPVHLEGLGSLEAIADAKAELLEGVPADGMVVANADDPRVRAIGERFPGRVVGFGHQAGDYRAVDVAPHAGRPGSRFRLLAPGGEEVAVELPLYGRYNVENFLAAAACAHALGVPLDAIAAAAAEATSVAGRGVLHRLPAGTLLVDDSYNSNPVALTRALESAAELPGKRHWAVLGDMLELGREELRFHRQQGEVAARLGFSPVAAVGELSRALGEGAEAAGAEAHWFATAAEAAPWAATQLRPQDVVLVKASRGVGLEAVVEALRREVEG